MDNELQSLSDGELLRRASEGDHHAFGRLYVKYYPLLLAWCRAITKNTHDAEDVVTEVFLLVIRKSRYYNPQYSFKNWLRRVALNTAINYMKRISNQHKPIGNAFEDKAVKLVEKDNPGCDTLVQERNDLLTAALNELEEVTRKCFVDHYAYKVTRQKLGELYGLSVKQIDRQLRRARLYLESRLKGLI